MNGAQPGRRRWREPQAGEPAGINARVLDEVRSRALASAGSLSGADLASAVHASGQVIGSGSAVRMVRELSDSMRGLGPLQALADVPGTTDVLVDAHGQVWCDGPAGLHGTGVSFESPAAVRELAVRLIAAGGRRLDDAAPFADVVLERYRIHAVLPPLSTGGPLLSIRIQAPETRTLYQLLPEEPTWRGAMEAIMAARLNFLICGGTGSGKTTLLSAMLLAVPADERIIVVEDACELTPPHRHLIGLQTRAGNVEGTGAVSLDTLLRQALRMRPDRLVVGECRGPEIRGFLGAMNTGHDGAGGTVHANSIRAVPARLLAMGALAGLDPAATALQATSALDVLIHMERRGAHRAPVQLGRLLPDSSGGMDVQTIATLDSTGVTRFGEGLDWFGSVLAARALQCPW